MLSFPALIMRYLHLFEGCSIGELHRYGQGHGSSGAEQIAPVFVRLLGEMLVYLQKDTLAIYQLSKILQTAQVMGFNNQFCHLQILRNITHTMAYHHRLGTRTIDHRTWLIPPRTSIYDHIH